MSLKCKLSFFVFCLFLLLHYGAKYPKREWSVSEILKINERNSKSRGGAWGRAGSLAVCNCSVCSLQQPPLQIIGALEVMGDFFFFFYHRFHVLHYRFQTQWSQQIDPPLLLFFFLHLNQTPSGTVFVPAAEFMSSFVIWSIRQNVYKSFKKKLNKKSKWNPACFCSSCSLWVYCRIISCSYYFFPSLHPIKADRDFIPAPFQDGLASTVGDAVLKSNKTH